MGYKFGLVRSERVCVPWSRNDHGFWRASWAHPPPTGSTEESDVRISNTAGERFVRPTAERQGSGDMAASASIAGRDRQATAGHRRARRHAQDATRPGFEPHPRHPICRCGAGRRPAPVDQAIHRKFRERAQAGGSNLAGFVGDEPVFHAGVPVRSRDRDASGRQRALESDASVAVRAAGPFSWHRCETARVQVRALDPSQVDRIARCVSARM